jgi:hypothetical protein
MNSYLGLEALTQLRIEQLHREAAQARLAARIGHPSRPGYRQQLARSLRAFARRIDPTCEPAAGQTRLVAAAR